jgi:type IV secretory pathway VirB10-like protein
LFDENKAFFISFTFNFRRNIMNNIIKLAFITTIALSAVACGDKTPVNNIITVTPATSKPIPQPPAAQPPAAAAQPPAAPAAQPQTSNNPIAQPALDAVEKAKQVEGVMKKEEATQKKAIDAK